MKIAVNMIQFWSGKMGGMEQFAANLIEGMSRTSEHEFYLFLNEFQMHLFNIEGCNVKKLSVSMNNSTEKQLKTWIDQLNIDVLLCPLFTRFLKVVHIPVCVLIPDVQHEYFPEFFQQSEREKRNRDIKDALEHADRIITISDFSKRTIIEKFEVNKKEIDVIYGDAPKEFQQPIRKQKIERIKKKYQLPVEFGLYPANFWPHKNHLNLLKALSVAKKYHNYSISIVFTGYEKADLQQFDKIQSLVQKLQLDEQISFLGYVPKKDIPYMYHLASFLIYPSLFEGFGIPLVEAMKTGTPIAAANAGSIPEIVQSAGLLFNPYDPNDIADKLVKIMDVKIRKKVIAKGKVRSKNFSWDKSGQKLLEIFHQIKNH
ncbi:glycosyltransferase family 1 protein [Aeribacillus composti]|uniref:glycosyltransferase family 4 protein n=1 Tax=Aeribacillus composti TaxID=1868734 RepID=UPI002E22086A|nr:glycosyltransferase family 1 protein [Aeribacillus composti]